MNRSFFTSLCNRDAWLTRPSKARVAGKSPAREVNFMTRRNFLKNAAGLFVPACFGIVRSAKAQQFFYNHPGGISAGSGDSIIQSSTTSDSNIDVGENGPDRTFVATQITAAQTFTATSFDVQLRKNAGAQTISAIIYSNVATSGGQPNTTLGTSTNTLSASTIVDDTYYSFTFSPGISLTSGTLYWLGLTATPINSSQFPLWRAISGSGRTEYSGSAIAWGLYGTGLFVCTYKLWGH